MDWDPWVATQPFEPVPAAPWQRIDVRIKTDSEGDGEFFWTGTTETQYGGFSPGKETHFQIIGDNQWHEYSIYPFWQAEERIIMLRLDFARPLEEDNGKKTFAVDYVRIIDLGAPDEITKDAAWDFTQGSHNWEPADGGSIQVTPDGLQFASGANPKSYILSAALRCPLEDRLWLHIEMKVDKGSAGYAKWVSSEFSGMQSAKFPLKADGRFHSYNIDMGAQKAWQGEILLLGLQPTNTADATAVIRNMAISEVPMGQAEIDLSYVGLENAVNRAGPRIPLIFNLMNRGGSPTTDLRIAKLDLPEGVTVAGPDNWRDIANLQPFEPGGHRVFLSAPEPVEGVLSVELAGSGAPPDPVEGELSITESLDLPKAAYVPEPQPVESDYEVGALYFPGFPTMQKWDPIRRHGPERKPVLGWYDEGNPECVDWQIKWAVEHGMKYFLVDWYWSAGGRSLEHWVNAYKKARYRGYLKWAMMWANHNAAGSHSEEDFRKVAKFWVDNYFNMPEYYQIDGKPVVMIWSPDGIARDMGGPEGVKKALTICRDIAVEAGHKGIYFIAMKWPEAGTDPAIIQRLADMGFDMTSIYHYMHHGGKAEDPTNFSFDLVVSSSYDHWKSWNEAGILPFLPNLSTGWDSRPWHGDRATVIYDRTPDKFRRICEDAKRFADQTGVKRMVLAPLNEWGEGSYAEPCKEFGFGMYDAVRDVFCKEPAGGWPANIAPVDVGLGPYDLPEIKFEKRTAWDFSDGKQGWGPAMGIGSFEAKEGAIHFVTSSRDPAITVMLNGAPAFKYKYVIFRMKIDSVTEDEKAQLFWATTTSGVNEAASMQFELIGDGEYHTYVVPVHENNRWRSMIQSFRFDPCSHSDATISITEVRLSEDGK